MCLLAEPLEKTLQDGPSVAYMKGQEGALISSLARKRRVLGWAHYLFVLVPNSKRIYQYRSELVGVVWVWFGCEQLLFYKLLTPPSLPRPFRIPLR